MVANRASATKQVWWRVYKHSPASGVVEDNNVSLPVRQRITREARRSGIDPRRVCVRYGVESEFTHWITTPTPAPEPPPPPPPPTEGHCNG